MALAQLMLHDHRRTLARWVHEAGPLDPEQAVAWAIRVLKALEPRHVRALPHGRVCAEAIVTNGTNAQAPAAIHTLVGRHSPVGYHSPERLADGRPSVVSDVWAVGVLLYLLLTGERPFPGATPRQVAASIAAGPPATLVSFGVAEPALQAIVDRLFTPLACRVVRAASLRQVLEQWAETRSAEHESGVYPVAAPDTTDDDDVITLEFDLATGSVVRPWRLPEALDAAADPEVTVEVIDDPELIAEIERLDRQAARAAPARSDPGELKPAVVDPQAVHALALVAHLEAALAAPRSARPPAPRATSSGRSVTLALCLLIAIQAAGAAFWLLFG